MNRTAVTQELDEASIAINELIQAIRTGEHDDDEALSPLAYKYQHILCHLARSWHYRNMTDQKIDQLSQEAFDEISYAVPGWGMEFKMVEAAWELDRM